MTKEYTHHEIQPGDINALDLIEEMKGLEEVACYYVTPCDDQGYLQADKAGEVLIALEFNRAGLCFGGDSTWIDADSIEEVIEYLENEGA